MYASIDEAVEEIAGYQRTEERTAALNRLLRRSTSASDLDWNANLLTQLRVRKVWPV